MSKLITFEGIDGSGKSTQVSLFEERLKDEGIACEVFREPGGTGLSEEIRKILLYYKGEIDPVAETLLFSAARAQISAEKVKPLLNAGKVVILDRFYDSTTAYQGFARGALDKKDIHTINRIASHGLVPDLTFYLRLEVQDALPRISDNKDRMEQTGIEFYQKVIDGFDELAARESRFCTIPATLPKEQVHDRIWEYYQAMVQTG